MRLGESVKNWFIIISGLFILFNSPTHAQDILGEETIEPLRYPKFSIGGGYPFSRKFHGFGHESLRANLGSRPFVTISMEAGLLKYLNAGAQYGFALSEVTKEEPIWMHFSLFAKPYLPLGSRLSIFTRLSGGLGFDFFESPVAPIGYIDGQYKTVKQDISVEQFTNAYRETYKDQKYAALGSWGAYSSATFGIEFFPIKRIGIAVEAGIRAYFLRKEKKWLSIDPEGFKDVPGAPSSFNYMLYDYSIMASLQAIL